MSREHGPSPEDIKFSTDDEETKLDSNLLAGVTKNKAGIPDYSKAAVLRLSPKEQEAFERGRERIEKEKVEARRKKLEIPPEVLPGTSTMVRYKLRNTVILKTERLNDLTGDSRKRMEAEIKQYKDEQAIVEELEDEEWSTHRLRDWEEKNGEFKGFETAEWNKASSIPAAEMIDMVDRLVRKWEEMAEENPTLNTVYIGAGAGGKIDFAKFLKEASDLKLRLAIEDTEARASLKEK
ncbi:MAG: hypothetical protein WCX08_03290 [Candidatus Buchananbacteria bacterium]|jgi:hypothetical protein